MASKWINIIFILIFIAYLYQKQPIAKPVAPEDREKTEKILSKLGNLIDNVNNDMNHNKPPVTKAANETKNYNSLDEGIKDIKDKAVDFTYNFIQTKLGQDILEKILYSPTKSSSQDSLPSLYHNNSMTDIITGEGDIAAECGDMVQVRYVTKQVNGTELENTNEKPVTFQLGDRKVIRGVEYAVIGMKEGGIRRLIVPPKYAYKDVNFSNDSLAGNEYITIEVELLKITQPNNKDIKNIRVYETTNLAPNLTAINLCSNPVYFGYNIANIDGKIIYQSKVLSSFILGSKDVPQSLSKALTNIKSPAKYTVILPSYIINKKTNFIPKNVKLPKDKAIILDIITTS